MVLCAEALLKEFKRFDIIGPCVWKGEMSMKISK